MDNEFRNLWVAVLARAAEDALSNTQQLLYNGVPTQVKFDAISWFSASATTQAGKAKNEDFKLVCLLANRDPHYVQEKMLSRLEETHNLKYFNRQEIKKRQSPEYNAQKVINKKANKLWFLERTWKHIRHLKYAQYKKKNYY